METNRKPSRIVIRKYGESHQEPCSGSPWKVAPLATGAQDIHHPVHDRTHVGPPLATARLRRRNQWCNIRPLVIREVARVPQVITIVFRSVLKRPHRRPLRESANQATSFESN